MDAIKLLEADHKKVKSLFRDYEKAERKDRKQRIADEIMNELRVHTQVEEEIFYPAFREKADDEGTELVAEAFEEHHVVKTVMAELEGLEAGDEVFDAKMTVMIENVEHHIEEEEGEMFPEAKGTLGEQNKELGARMEQMKEQLQAKPKAA
jgi:hemerythrin superfamily protein